MTATLPPEEPRDTEPAEVNGAPETPALGRQIALGAVAFVATLILLFGLASLIRPSGGGAGVASASASDLATPAVPSPAASPSPSSGVASPSASGAPPSGPGVSASSSGAATPPASGALASPTPSGDPVLVGAGDIADCGLDGDSATAALVEANRGTVFTVGDNVYPNGSADGFRDCYEPTWGRFLDRTRPAAGNHDWESKDLAGYLGYFGAAAAPNGTSWYSYDLGAWHIVVLDSNCGSVGGCGPDSAQGRWLTTDLAGSRAQCTLAIWHHPRISSGEHGNDETVGPFWRALYDAGADLVINGHDHDYERFAPQDPDGREDRERGIRQFVVGTGGAVLRTFPTNVPNSELRAAVSHGVIRLVLRPTSYEWKFIPTTGDFSDSGRGPCH